MAAAPTTRPTASPDRPVPPTGFLPSPGVLLRVEGLALLLVAVLAYARIGTSWWLFAALFLAPDLGLLGYLAGPRPGARLYNLTHTLVAPMVLAAVGIVTAASLPLDIALIWAAHIGMDRAVGYGLKYPTGFRDTHLQRVA